MEIFFRQMTDDDIGVVDFGGNDFLDWGDSNEETGTIGDSDLSRDGAAIVSLKLDGIAAGVLTWSRHPWGPTEESLSAMIGVWIAKKHRGQGIGAAAQSALVHALFSKGGFHRIDAHTDVSNSYEQKALEKIGFQLEGVVRSAQWRQGGWRDLCIYGLLDSQWDLQGNCPDILGGGFVDSSRPLTRRDGVIDAPMFVK